MANLSEDYLSVGDEGQQSVASAAKSEKSKSSKVKSSTNKSTMSSLIDYKKMDVINQMIFNINKAGNFTEVIQ